MVVIAVELMMMVMIVVVELLVVNEWLRSNRVFT